MEQVSGITFNQAINNRERIKNITDVIIGKSHNPTYESMAGNTGVANSIMLEQVLRNQVESHAAIMQAIQNLKNQKPDN